MFFIFVTVGFERKKFFTGDKKKKTLASFNCRKTLAMFSVTYQVNVSLKKLTTLIPLMILIVISSL